MSANLGSPLRLFSKIFKREGKLADRRPARFPYAVICGACGFTTDWVRLAGRGQKRPLIQCGVSQVLPLAGVFGRSLNQFC